MGRLFAVCLFLLLIGTIGYLAGDRYGVPAWLADSVDPMFEPVDTHLGYSDRVVIAKAGKDTEEERLALAAKTRDDLPNPAMRINEAGLDIIKQSEGLRLEAYDYGGRSYIGYGHQLAPGEPRSISEPQATAFLLEDLREAEHGVLRRLTRTPNANQFSAMVSLAYNLGTGAFARSNVPILFNEGDMQGAADAFLTHNRAGGRVLDHLTDRREKERALFLTPA
ncbi:MAG: lysozyme [Pseudomonadota bacterium]